MIKYNNKKSGMTLMELLVVIVIIGILVAFGLIAVRLMSRDYAQRKLPQSMYNNLKAINAEILVRNPQEKRSGYDDSSVYNAGEGIDIEQSFIPGEIVCYRPVSPGENVIRAGEDVRAGDVILRRGQRITSGEAGMLAGLGIRQVRVFRRPSVTVISTGDELAGPGETLSGGIPVAETLSPAINTISPSFKRSDIVIDVSALISSTGKTSIFTFVSSVFKKLLNTLQASACKNTFALFA